MSSSTLDALPRIGLASVACSAAVIEFTVPQIVKLSQTSGRPLPLAPLPIRLLIMGRALGPQVGLTVVQFSAVRQLGELLDSTLGPKPVNLSLAYGTASVPLIAAKYNLLFADVYRHFKAQPPQAPAESRLAFWTQQWETKIRPGLLWSYLRDTISVGGAIVLAPLIASTVASRAAAAAGAQRGEHGEGGEGGEASRRVLQFLSGLLAGCGTGLATQVDR